MNKVTIYRYDENKPVRTLNLNGEPWFVLRDVCEVLGLGNSRMVADLSLIHISEPTRP